MHSSRTDNVSTKACVYSTAHY